MRRHAIMNVTENRSVRAAGGLLPRYARVIVLTFALFLGGASVGAYAPALFATIDASVAQAHDERADTAQAETIPVGAPGASCDVATQRVEAEAWARSELFFGTAKPDGSAVSDAEWRGFLDK